MSSLNIQPFTSEYMRHWSPPDPDTVVSQTDRIDALTQMGRVFPPPHEFSKFGGLPMGMFTQKPETDTVVVVERLDNSDGSIS